MKAELPRPLLVMLVALLVLLAAHARYGGHIGDFWEHTAVVKELAAHPLEPLHPLFLSHDPHPFYSPYALTLGLFARATGMQPEHVLTLAGMANVCLVAIGLLRFVVALGLPRAAAAYTLLLTLFLWGVNPWLYGGFLHIGAIGYTAPYPSTFVFGLALFVPELAQRQRYGALVALLAVVILSHPMSAVFAFTLLFAFAARPFAAVAVSVVAGMLTFAWPYYSSLALFMKGTEAAHASNHWIYPGVLPFLRQVYPSLAAVPVLAMRFRVDPRDPLGWSFVALASVYSLGGVSEAWAVGRVLPHAVFLLHVALAGWACRAGRGAFAALLVLVAVLGLRGAPDLWGYVSGAKGGAERYRVLAQYVGDYDVVMAHPAASYFIPAFAGRIVGTNWAVFLGDPGERRFHARRFFRADIGNSERRALIERYCVAYLVVDLRAMGATRAQVQWAWTLGEVVYNDDDLYLFRVDPGACADSSRL